MTGDDGQLELIALRRRFGDTVALDGPTFTVPRGQALASSGPNGAGERTAMAYELRLPGWELSPQSSPWPRRSGWRGWPGNIHGRAILRTGSRLKVRQVLRSAA